MTEGGRVTASGTCWEGPCRSHTQARLRLSLEDPQRVGIIPVGTHS